MVECVKKIVCRGRTNWPLRSVLFGLLSTEGTKRKHKGVHTQQRGLIVGLRRVKRHHISPLVLGSPLPTADLTHSPYRRQLCSLFSKTNMLKLNPQTCKILVTSFGIWVSLYKSSMQIPLPISRIFFSFFFSFFPAVHCFLFLFFLQVYLLELSIYTKISLTFSSPASCRLALRATQLVD